MRLARESCATLRLLIVIAGEPYDFLADEVSRLSNGELEIEYAGGSDVIGGFDAPKRLRTAL